MSRDAFIAADRAWWRAIPPAGRRFAALSIMLLLAIVLFAVGASRSLIALLGMAALAITIADAALTRRPRIGRVTVELPPEITPDRARLLLLGSLNVRGVHNPTSASCHVVGLEASATVFRIDFEVADDVDPADVHSRVLTRIWHTRQRAMAGPAENPAAALQALDCTPLLVTLPGEIKEEMAAGAEVEFWDMGEHVVEQGASDDSCFIVRHGRLTVYVTDGRSEVHVATLGKGDLFGEMSLLTGEPRGATVRTEEHAELVRIRASALKTVLKRSPELVQLLAETAARRRDAVTEACAELDRKNGVSLPDAMRNHLPIARD